MSRTRNFDDVLGISKKSIKKRRLQPVVETVEGIENSRDADAVEDALEDGAADKAADKVADKVADKANEAADNASEAGKAEAKDEVKDEAKDEAKDEVKDQAAASIDLPQPEARLSNARGVEEAAADKHDINRALLEQLKCEIAFLKDQIRVKDVQIETKEKQLENKDELLRNFQVLLKSEQDRVLRLESRMAAPEGVGNGFDEPLNDSVEKVSWFKRLFR